MKKPLLIFLLFPSLLLFAQVPKVEDIKETGPDQSRSISIPFSRLVINPFSFYGSTGATTQSQFSNSPSMPLNLGYLSTERVNARRMNDVMEVYQYKPGIGTPDIINTWTGDVTSTSSWSTDTQTSLWVVDRGLKFSVNSGASPIFKFLRPSSRISIDFNKPQILTVNVPEAGGGWVLKINNSYGEEFILKSQGPDFGQFEFDIKAITGWTGPQQVFFDLWAVGIGSYFILSDIKVLSPQSQEMPCMEATDYSTAWQANELPFHAVYDDNVVMDGTDFFYDKNTIIRKMHFNSNYTGSPSFIICGYYSGNDVALTDDILYVDNGTFRYAIKSSVLTSANIRFYKTRLELLGQVNGSTSPSTDGYWSVQFDLDTLPDKELSTSIAFSYKNDNEEDVVLTDRVEQPFYSNNMEVQYNAQKEYWNDFYSKVPLPLNFAIETVNAKGVTAGQVRNIYYKAWVHIAQNVMEADPQNYIYPQIVTGKPSMWDEGAEQAPYSATWESFFGMQFYAFIDPQTSWDAFEGIMSLVGETGMIGGESLPSRKAQTAWILYQITKDRTRLARVYDALERYLNWRLQYPHWIYAGNPETAYPDPNKKDADFAFSAIIDIDYMIKISKVLKGEFVAYEWEDKKMDFFDKCLSWFWTTPDSRPYQYYNTSTGGRAYGNIYWVTKGLHVDLLKNETAYLNSMYSAFSDNFNSDYNFGGISLGYPKYPDVGYTLYGLIDNSKVDNATNLIDVSIRDVVRSGNWLAESYEITDNQGIPYPSGVRPSTFGAAMIIDFVMIKNGFRYDYGKPYIQNLFKGARSIKGIRFSGRVLNIESDSKGLFTVSGNYLEEPQTIQTKEGEFLPIEGGLVSSKTGELIRPQVYNKAGGIIIRNFGNDIVNIYNVAGVKIRSFNNAGSILDVNLNRGVYIVQIGMESHKIIVY